jgi:hypothetical protein
MKWYEQSLEMRKYILNVLVYQKPVTLSVGCLMPELTLRFFLFGKTFLVYMILHSFLYIICILVFGTSI